VRVRVPPRVLTELTMKLLLFSDVHCSRPAVQRLLEQAAGADILVGAGDFGIMRRGTVETLAPFRDVGKPFVAVPGNAESIEQLQAALSWENAYALHGNEAVVNGITFFGFGGGVPVTPFGEWSYDFTEGEASLALQLVAAGSLLVVHSPPHGVVDRSSRGMHLGSTAIRDTILRTRPALVVCGHIHDCSGQIESLGGTPVVNAGPLGILWDLETGQRIGTQA
jgi:uncharacterized protein